MIYCTRMLITSALFVTALGGLPSMLPGSMEMLGLDWNKLVESYNSHRNGQRTLQELKKKDALILRILAKKESLVVQLFQGKISLVKAGQCFRQWDQEGGYLAKLRNNWTDAKYCQEVLEWAQATFRSDGSRLDPTILQQLETQLHDLTSPSNTGNLSPGLEVAPEAGQGVDRAGLAGDLDVVAVVPAHTSVLANAGLVPL
jgi:hypothetical protein